MVGKNMIPPNSHCAEWSFTMVENTKKTPRNKPKAIPINMSDEGKFTTHYLPAPHMGKVTCR